MICRVCDSQNLKMVLDLGNQPWCNDFLSKDQVGKEPFYPLRLFYCEDCCTAQLDYTVPKEIMFGNHTYLSGVTKSLNAHFKEIAENTLNNFYLKENFSKIKVLDIGSNDGTQLKHFQKLGCTVLGVESSEKTAKIAIDAGVPTINKFFNAELVKEIEGKFDVINAAGVFFHLEELHSAAVGIKEALANTGVFVVQFLYMKKIIENLAFDQIYHEHLLYYNLKTIEVLLNRHGMEVFDAYIAPIHGGSMIAYVTHKGAKDKTDRLIQLIEEENTSKANDISTYFEFAKTIEVMKEINLTYLKDKKSQGKIIYGMGAPVKGNTLLNYFNIGLETLDFLVEKNSLRDGLYSPGKHIPVVMEDDQLIPPDVYYVLAWNFKKEILNNNKHLIDSGVEFFFPVNPQE